MSNSYENQGLLSGIITRDDQARQPDTNLNLKKVGDQTYMKVPTSFSTGRSVRQPRSIRESLEQKRTSRTSPAPRLGKLSRGEQWVAVQTGQEQPSPFIDVASTTQINDTIDAFSQTFTQMKGRNIFASYADKFFWDLDGEGNSLAQNLFRPIEQAIKGDIDTLTMFKAIGVNAFGSTGQTLDIVANPVKGFLADGTRGLANSFGINETGERYNYNYDTGNIVADIILEIVSDPINWLSLGSKAITGGVVKGVSTALKESSEELIQKSTLKVSKGLSTTLSESLEETVLKASKKSIDNVVTKSIRGEFDTMYKNALKKLGENAADEDILKEVTSNLTDRFSRDLTSRTIKIFTKQGQKVGSDSAKLIKSYVDDFAKEIINIQTAKRIQSSLDSGLFKFSKFLGGVDDAITKFSVTTGTLGFSSVVKYSLMKTGVPKLLDKIPSNILIGVQGALAGAVVGGLATGSLEGAGAGALIGSGISIANVVMVHGATMRTMLRGVPKDSELYQLLKQGKVKLADYADLTKQYDDIFNTYYTMLDADDLKSKFEKMKHKTSWYTSYTVEGLNPLQMTMLKQINEDTNVFYLLVKKSSENPKDALRAIESYIKETHGLTISEYLSQVANVASVEKGAFNASISKISTAIEFAKAKVLLSELSDDALKNLDLEGADNLAKEVKKLLADIGNNKESYTMGSAVYIDSKNRLTLDEAVRYYAVVRSDLAMLKEYATVFEVITEKYIYLKEDMPDAIRKIYDSCEELSILATFAEYVKSKFIVKSGLHDDKYLQDAFAKAFWDLKDAPYNTTNEELAQLWLSKASEHATFAKVYRKDKTSTVSNQYSFTEHYDDMLEILNLMNKEHSLQNAMNLFKNIDNADDTLSTIDRLIRNQSKFRKAILDEGGDASKADDMLGMLWEYKNRLAKAYGRKYELNEMRGFLFKSTDKNLGDYRASTYSFNKWIDLQRAMGTELKLQEVVDVDLLAKYFNNVTSPTGFNEGTLAEITDMLKTAEAVKCSITDTAPIDPDSVVGKQIDEFWKSMVESATSGDQANLLIRQLKRELTMTEKFGMIYAVVQKYTYSKGDYRKYSHAFWSVWMNATKEGKFAELAHLIANPNKLGFQYFKPGLRNSIKQVVTNPEVPFIYSLNARKAINANNGEKVYRSFVSTRVRVLKDSTISGPAHKDFLKTCENLSLRYKATENALGKVLDRATKAQNPLNSNVIHGRILQGIPSLGGKNPYLTKKDANILKDFHDFGKTPDDPQAIAKIAKKADAYDQDRFEINRVLDNTIPNPQQRKSIKGYLASDPEGMDADNLKGRYVGRHEGAHLTSKKVRHDVEALLTSAKMDNEAKQKMLKIIRSGDKNRYVEFLDLLTTEVETASGEIREIVSLIEGELRKFSKGDALRYFITKNDKLTPDELAEYFSIMRDLRDKHGLYEIPESMLPNSFKVYWVQERLSHWNAQAHVLGSDPADSAVRLTGYGNHTVFAVGKPIDNIKETEDYINLFREELGSMIDAYSNGYLIRSVLASLTDEQFTKTTKSYSAVVQQATPGLYKRVYIANYAETAKRGQMPLSKSFNYGNSHIHRQTITDILSGDYNRKIDSSVYLQMLEDLDIYYDTVKFALDPLKPLKEIYEDVKINEAKLGTIEDDIVGYQNKITEVTAKIDSKESKFIEIPEDEQTDIIHTYIELENTKFELDEFDKNNPIPTNADKDIADFMLFAMEEQNDRLKDRLRDNIKAIEDRLQVYMDKYGKESVEKVPVLKDLKQSVEDNRVLAPPTIEGTTPYITKIYTNAYEKAKPIEEKIASLKAKHNSYLESAQTADNMDDLRASAIGRVTGESVVVEYKKIQMPPNEFIGGANRAQTKKFVEAYEKVNAVKAELDDVVRRKNDLNFIIGSVKKDIESLEKLGSSSEVLTSSIEKYSKTVEEFEHIETALRDRLNKAEASYRSIRSNYEQEHIDSYLKKYHEYIGSLKNEKKLSKMDIAILYDAYPIKERNEDVIQRLVGDIPQLPSLFKPATAKELATEKVQYETSLKFLEDSLAPFKKKKQEYADKYGKEALAEYEDAYEKYYEKVKVTDLDYDTRRRVVNGRKGLRATEEKLEVLDKEYESIKADYEQESDKINLAIAEQEEKLATYKDLVESKDPKLVEEYNSLIDARTQLELGMNLKKEAFEKSHSKLTDDLISYRMTAKSHIKKYGESKIKKELTRAETEIKAEIEIKRALDKIRKLENKLTVEEGASVSKVYKALESSEEQLKKLKIAYDDKLKDFREQLSKDPTNKNLKADFDFFMKSEADRFAKLNAKISSYTQTKNIYAKRFGAKFIDEYVQAFDEIKKNKDLLTVYNEKLADLGTVEEALEEAERLNKLKDDMEFCETVINDATNLTQTALLSSAPLQKNSLGLRLQHDGPPINIKAPSAPADKVMRDLNDAVDGQENTCISLRMNQTASNVLLDIASQNGVMVFPLSMVESDPNIRHFINNDGFKRSGFSQGGDVLTIVDKKNEAVIIFTNINNTSVNFDSAESVVRHKLHRGRKEAVSQQATAKVAKRTYSGVANIDKALHKHMTILQNATNEGYGKYWHRGGWGSTANDADEDFFNLLFNGHNAEDISEMKGSVMSLGGDEVNYWQGLSLTKKDRERLVKMGWLDADGNFNSKNYLNSYGGYASNNALMGGSGFCQKFYPSTSKDFIDSFQQKVNTTAAKMKTQIEWVSEVYSNSLSINAILASGISKQDLVDEIIQYRTDSIVGVLIVDTKTKTGLSFKEYSVNSVKDLDFAIKHKAVIMPRSDAYATMRYLNHAERTNHIWSFLSKTMYLFKYGWLSLNPGTLLRNWVDTELKTKIELGSDSAFYKQYAGVILKEFEIIATKVMLDEGKTFILKSDIDRFFRRDDLAQMGIKNVDKDLFYQVNDLMTNGPMSNIVQEDYSKIVLRSKRGNIKLKNADAVEDKFSSVIGFLNEKNPMVHMNNRIENVNRMALFLHSIDNEWTNSMDFTNNLGIKFSDMAKERAYSRLRRVHFDYNNKSDGLKKLEMIFPFLGWTMDNTRYWLGILENKPWVVRNIFNVYDPIWSLEDYTPEQLEQSIALQDMILKMNIPLYGPNGVLGAGSDETRTQVFKLGPSFSDAFAGISNPVEVLRNRINSVGSSAVSKLREGLIPYEEYLEDDVTRNPGMYFEAGNKFSSVANTLQEYSSFVPIIGSIYSRLYTAGKQATSSDRIVNAVSAMGGASGVTSNVQLVPSYKPIIDWDSTRSIHNQVSSFKNLVGRRISQPVGYASANALPNKDPMKIWNRFYTPKNISFTSKVQSRKYSAQLYGINVSAFR